MMMMMMMMIDDDSRHHFQSVWRHDLSFSPYIIENAVISWRHSVICICVISIDHTASWLFTLTYLLTYLLVRQITTTRKLRRALRVSRRRSRRCELVTWAKVIIGYNRTTRYSRRPTAIEPVDQAAPQMSSTSTATSVCNNYNQITISIFILQETGS